MQSSLEWKASFAVPNVTVEEPFSINGMQFEVHPKSTKETLRVLVTYRFATPTNYPVQNIAREVQDKIERFLACANANLALSGYDVREPIEEFDLEVENWKQLLRQGLSPPTKFSMQFRNTSTYSRDFALTAWKWADTLASHHDGDIVFRVLKLLRQSMLESDEYDRFSKIWRGFNALYNHLAGNPQSPEASRIKNLARRLLQIASRPNGWVEHTIQEYWTPLPRPVQLNDQLTMILATRNWASVMDCFVKQGFVARDGTDYSQALAGAIATKGLSDALESALLCVYVERNKILHGEVVSDTERDLLYVCASFLQRIVAIALNEFYFIPMKTSP